MFSFPCHKALIDNGRPKGMFGMCLMGRHASLVLQLKVCGFKDEKQISPLQIKLFLLTSKDELF